MSDKIPDDVEIRMAERVGLTVQPPPIANNFPSAHDIVGQLITDSHVSGDVGEWNAGALRILQNQLVSMYIALCGGRGLAYEEMMARKEFGLAKYGTHLQPFNGRDSLADATDELGDLLVYVAVATAEAEVEEQQRAVEGAYDDDREAGWG